MLKTNENFFKLLFLLIWITCVYIRGLMIRFFAFYNSHVSTKKKKKKKKWGIENDLKLVEDFNNVKCFEFNFSI